MSNEDASILGIDTMSVSCHSEHSFTELPRDAYLGALNGARLSDPQHVRGTWLASFPEELGLAPSDGGRLGR